MAVKYWTGKADLYEFNYDGGEHSPVAGEVIYVDGAEGTEYATIQSWTVSGGAWATNDATGKMWVYSATAAFIANLVNNDVIEDSGGTTICDTTGAVTARTSGDWQLVGNWGTGEDPAIPVADDEVIFDGRSTLCPTEGMLDIESGGVAQCTFDLLHFKSTWAQGVASAAEPLICAPDKVQIDGTGTYYICCGKTDQNTDADVDDCIINNKDAIVYLYSNCNDGAQTAIWTNIHVVAVATLYLKYYTVDTEDCGCACTTMWMAPTSGQQSKAKVYIEKDNYNIKASTATNVYMDNGQLYSDSALGNVYFFDGIIYYGTDLGASPETGLDITALYQWGGTFNWRPDDSDDDAVLTTAFIYGGLFDASGTTNNDRAKVFGNTVAHIFTGATANLANGKGNITFGTVFNHGGTLTLDPGVAVGVTYDT
jgi:hypothetical protein